MTRWDLVYKWADPETRSLVDAVTSALENCDRKLTEARTSTPDTRLDVERLTRALANVGDPTSPERIAAEYARFSSTDPSDWSNHSMEHVIGQDQP